MPANPFSIDPTMGRRGGELSGLADVMRENRERTALAAKEQAAGEAKQALDIQFGEVLRGGDQLAMAEFAGKNKQYSAAIRNQYGITNERTEAVTRNMVSRISVIDDPAQAADVLRQGAEQIKAMGGNPQFTMASMDKLLSGDVNELAQIKTVGAGMFPDMGRDAGLTAKQREFASQTEGLTEEQKNEARLIDLGLSPRAMGSAIQTIAAGGLAEEVGDAEAIIAQRKKFGDLTGVARAKQIDNGFSRIGKIDKGIRTIDRAIEVLESGAGTGALEKYLPSLKAASVELDQIQGELALDVIGSVTFGALSEGELRLAKEIALPSGLEGPELIEHLKKRKVAQEKLRGYFYEQIQFLDQGGTIAGFMRKKESEQGGNPQSEAAPASQDSAAMEWAQANPSDPRAAQILAMQGGR